MKLRGSVQSLHRPLGLTLGIWFAFLGLFGSVLVFWQALEDHACADTAIQAEGPASPLESLVARLAEACPEADVYRTHLPQTPFGAIRLECLAPVAGICAW